MDWFNETNENFNNTTDEEIDESDNIILVIFVTWICCAFLYFCCLDFCSDLFHMFRHCKCKFFSTRKKTIQKIEIDVEINKLYTIENCYFNKNNCTICFQKKKKHAVLKCKHSFCKVCIDKWLEKNKNCPLCREIIE